MYTIYVREVNQTSYIGCTKNYERRCKEHLQQHTDAVFLILDNAPTKEKAEELEAIYIRIYKATEGYRCVNVSDVGNSSYRQSQSTQKRRSKAIKQTALRRKKDVDNGSVMRCVALIDPDTGKHLMFVSQTAVGEYLDVPANSVNDWLNNHIPRLKSIGDGHPDVYYPDDPRPDNVFLIELKKLFET